MKYQENKLLITMAAVAGLALVLSIVALIVGSDVSNKLSDLKEEVNTRYAKKTEVDKKLAEVKKHAKVAYEPKGAAGHVVKTLTDTQRREAHLPDSTQYVVRPHSKFSIPTTRPYDIGNETVVSFYAQVNEGWEDQTLFTIPKFGGVSLNSSLNGFDYVPGFKDAIASDTITNSDPTDDTITRPVLEPLIPGRWYHFAFHLTPNMVAQAASAPPHTHCTVYVNGTVWGTASHQSKLYRPGNKNHVAPGRVVIDLPEGSGLAHLGVVYGTHATPTTNNNDDSSGIRSMMQLVQALKLNDVSKISSDGRTKQFDYLDLSDSSAVSSIHLH